MNTIDEILYMFYGWDTICWVDTKQGIEGIQRKDGIYTYEMYGIHVQCTYSTYFSIIERKI
jgi:hypothetical protein